MKERLNRLWKWIETRWKWYVLGYYHCDRCPYSWEERGYEDCDAGCYIKGDIQDSCRLIPPFRAIIGWPRKRAYLYHEAHAYDGIGEIYEENSRKQKIFAESVIILLDQIELWQRDSNGKPFPICKEELLEVYAMGGSHLFDAYIYYENHAHPVKFVPLKQRWKELIKLTWKHLVYDHIAPYLPQKRRKKK